MWPRLTNEMKGACTSMRIREILLRFNQQTSDAVAIISQSKQKIDLWDRCVSELFLFFTYSEYYIHFFLIRVGIGVSKLNTIAVFRIQYRKIVTTIEQGGGVRKEMRYICFGFKTHEFIKFAYVPAAFPLSTLQIEKVNYANLWVFFQSIWVLMHPQSSFFYHFVEDTYPGFHIVCTTYGYRFPWPELSVYCYTRFSLPPPSLTNIIFFLAIM